MEGLVLTDTWMTDFVNDFCMGKDTQTEQIIAGMTAIIEGNEFALEKMKNQKWFERIWFTVTGKNKAAVIEMTQKRDVLAKFTVQLFIKMLDMLSNNSRVIEDLYRAVTILSLTVDRSATNLNNLAVKLNEKIISIDNYNNIITDIQNDIFDKNQPILSLIDIMSLVDERTARDSAKLERIKETMIKNGFQFNVTIRANEIAEQVFSLSEEKVGRIYLCCQKLSSRSRFLVYICRLIENYFYESLTERRIARQNGSVIRNARESSGITFNSECFLDDLFIDIKNNLFDELPALRAERLEEKSVNTEEAKENGKCIEDEKNVKKVKNIENIKKPGTDSADKKCKKRLMIVKGNGKEAQYAQLLFQLIGKLSNYEAFQPITEAEYKASYLRADNMSDEKVIFLESGKEALILEKVVKWQYDCFGMRYGWLENRCVITADPDRISINEQNAFAKYYNNRIEKFRQILELRRIHYSETKKSGVQEEAEADEDKRKNTDDVAGEVIKAVAADFFAAPLAVAKGAADKLKNIRTATEKEELWRHQYELLLCQYIHSGLACFMNNNMEKDVKRRVFIVFDTKNWEYAHLLQGLIQQYSGYDAVECTEKTFIDCAKYLSSKDKIIFLGKTKSSKERWLDSNRYIYYENGMRYGWIGNHAFIYAKQLKISEVKTFIEAYQHKSKEFEDKAKAYNKNKDSNIGTKVAMGLTMAGIATMFSLPALGGIFAYAVTTGIADLSGYQYQLLLREFVFNDFKKFMEEA